MNIAQKYIGSVGLLTMITLFLVVMIGSCTKKKSADEAALTGDYVKLKANGSNLDDQEEAYDPEGSEDDSSQWSCVRVNNGSGVLWEVKSSDENNERYTENVYSWYDPGASNTGSANGPSSCSATICTTKAYIDFVNNLEGGKGLCGKNNWRLPTVNELNSIASLGKSPTIDLSFFPNTFVGAYWSSETSPDNAQKALVVLFTQNLKTAKSAKSTGQNQIRLISSK